MQNLVQTFFKLSHICYDSHYVCLFCAGVRQGWVGQDFGGRASDCDAEFGRTFDGRRTARDDTGSRYRRRRRDRLRRCDAHECIVAVVVVVVDVAVMNENTVCWCVKNTNFCRIPKNDENLL